VNNVLSRQRGFSLIEMMVALFIVGILLAIATPNYVDMSRSFSKSNVRIQLLQDLRRGQATTVSEGCRGVFSFSSDGRSYSFGCDYLPYSEANPPVADSLRFTKELAKGFSVSADATILFNSKGQVIDSDGVLDSRSLQVNLDGDGVVARGTLRPTGFFNFDRS